jgi:hypothetical protein
MPFDIPTEPLRRLWRGVPEKSTAGSSETALQYSGQFFSSALICSQIWDEIRRYNFQYSSAIK